MYKPMDLAPEMMAATEVMARLAKKPHPRDFQDQIYSDLNVVKLVERIAQSASVPHTPKMDEVLPAPKLDQVYRAKEEAWAEIALVPLNKMAFSGKFKSGASISKTTMGSAGARPECRRKRPYTDRSTVICSGADSTSSMIAVRSSPLVATRCTATYDFCARRSKRILLLRVAPLQSDQCQEQLRKMSPPARPQGRPSVKGTVKKIWDARRKRVCALAKTKKAEADAILAEWPTDEKTPAGKPKTPPGKKTIVKHISPLWPRKNGA